MPDQQTGAVREITGDPSAVPLLLKAALPALPGVSAIPGVGPSGAKELPATRLVRRGVGMDPAHVAAYARICGFPVKDTVPLPYPHMLAFGLHMTLMTGRDFPFPAMGTVHLENRIITHRALGKDEVVDVAVWTENLRGHAKGRVYDMRTEVTVGDDVVWEETSTFLRRGRGDDDALPGLEIEQVPPSGTVWRLPGDLGRRYGAISGDRNPIHLYGVTAKAFGFPRQIAHGMWTMARCVAALENRLPEAATVEVAFKTPVLLPGSVAFGSRVGDRRGDLLFSLSNPRNGAPHLVGRTSPA